MPTDESLGETIRAGLSEDGAPVAYAVEQRLAEVHARYRRRRRTRITLGVAAVIVVIAGPWAAMGVLQAPESDPRPAGTAEIIGTYRVQVSARGRTAALAGTWTVVMARDGEVALRPPAGYTGPGRAGSSYQVSDGQLRTDAFLDWPGCQRTASSIGTYDVSRTGDGVAFTVVADSCAARLALFGSPWVRMP